MATQVNLEFNVEGASLVDLRNQLKDLKNAMAEATDPEQMSQLAQAAGEVKDRMKDVNEQMNEMAAGSPFEKVKNNISGMKAGLMDLDFDKVAASATNLANNASKISFSTATQGIKSMGTAFAQVGKALLTNPIFLIAAAIAAAVVVVAIILNKLGLMKPIMEAVKKVIDQVTGAFEELGEMMGFTNKKAEEAAKQREAAKKASEEQSAAIGKESSAYIGLVYQLAATKQGSQERKDIIDQLNSQYGTTFKNIQDETAFQSQLNIAVNDYIQFKIAEYKLKANEAEVQKLIAQRVELEKQQVKQLQDSEASQLRLKTAIADSRDVFQDFNLRLAKQNGLGALESAANSSTESLNVTLGQIGNIDQRLRELGGAALGFKQEMNATGVQTEEQRKKEEEARKKAEAAAAEAAKKAQDLRKETIKSIKDQFDKEYDLAEKIEDKKLDLLTDGLDKQKALRVEKFQDEKDKILKDSIAAEIETLNKKFEAGTIKEAEYRTQLADLRLNAEKNLSDQERELLIGAQAQLDRDLLKMQTDFDNQKILKQLENNKNIAKSFKELKDIELQIIDETARQALAKDGITAEERTSILNKQITDTERVNKEIVDMDRQVADVRRQMGLEGLTNATANAKSELDLAKEGSDEKIKLLGIYNQALIAQLEAERNAKLAAADQEIADLEAKRQKAEAGEGPDLNDLELARFQKLEQDKANIQDEFRRQKIAADIAAEEQIAQERKKKEEEIIADISKYAAGAAQLIGMLSDLQNNSLEIQQQKQAQIHAEQLEGLEEGSVEYNNVKKQQAIAEEELQKKIFEANKKQQIASAIVQGVQSVLNAYSSGVAIPIAGISMGPIFAAIAAGVAASNIAKIKAQQFQGGGGGGGSTVSSTSVDTVSAANDAAQPIIQMFGQGNDANTETFGKKSAPTFNVVATVSETDMTATQKRVAAMQANAEL